MMVRELEKMRKETSIEVYSFLARFTVRIFLYTHKIWHLHILDQSDHSG